METGRATSISVSETCHGGPPPENSGGKSDAFLFSADCRVPVSRPNSHFSVEIILPSVAGIGSESNRNPGTVSISDHKTSYCKISLSLEVARLVV